MAAWANNWLERHQHPVCRFAHALAIPLIPAAAIFAVVQLTEGAWSLWWRPAGLLAVSCVLQWFGHRIEGNDMGEVIVAKRLLRRHYVAVSPRYIGVRLQPMGRRPATSVNHEQSTDSSLAHGGG